MDLPDVWKRRALRLWMRCLSLGLACIVALWGIRLPARALDWGFASWVSYTAPSELHIIPEGRDGVFYADNQLLVTVQDGVPRSYIENLAENYRAQVVGWIEVTGDYQLEFSESRSLPELEILASQLLAEGLVESTCIHYLYKVEYDAVPNDTLWAAEDWAGQAPGSLNWGAKAINAMAGWDYAEPMYTVNVGILDSMFDTSHEDLNYTKVWNSPSLTLSQSSPSARNAHGTLVSGVIAARYNNAVGIAGVAPKTNLYAYGTLSQIQDLSDADVLMGMMEWKYALANLIFSNCKVINCAIQPAALVSDAECAVLERFLKKLLGCGYDFILVQSAGNHASNAAGGLLGSLDDPEIRSRVLVVGAMGLDDTGCFYYAPFSNYGERVDLAAPGVSIYSCMPDNRYATWSGTSAAAAHVSGAAAVCFGINPQLTGPQVKEILIQSGGMAGKTVADTSNQETSWNGVVYPPHRQLKTYPVVNVRSAVEQAFEIR